MNILKGIAKAGASVGRFFTSMGKAEDVLQNLTPEAKAAAVKTFSDVLAFVSAAEAAAATKGTDFAIDATVLAYAKQLYSDAVADIATAKQVFSALGINLPVPTVAK